jgi:hypothetical protein
MKNLKFPINLTFNIATVSNDFSALDAEDRVIAYVRQKLFKLKEDIEVFSDESRSEVNYKIKADRWIDFSAAYSITNGDGSELGKIARKGWRSMWKAEYHIIDQNEQFQYAVREENAWVRVMDHLIGEVPVVGMLTGYFFNPAYLVLDSNERPVVKLKKEKSFFGRKFQISKLENIDHDDQERIILSLMMMILLERRRG